MLYILIIFINYYFLQLVMVNSSKIVEDVEIKSLVTEENSRLRTADDLNVLMESIKQVGVLEPILVRKEDRVVICGNRRLEASKKLGNKTIPVIWKENISDDELLVMNLTENIQRKSIASMEIGRICNLLAERGLTLGEIATRLSIPTQRVKVCMEAYKRTPSEFKGRIKHVIAGNDKSSGIPESVFFEIIRMNRIKKMTDDDYNLLLKYALEENISGSKIRIMSNLYRQRMPIKEIIRKFKDYSTHQCQIIFNKEQLENVLKKRKLDSPTELIKQLLDKEDKGLLY